MIRTQIQLKEEQVRVLKKLAAARGVSMAELIRQSVDALIRSSTGIGISDEERRRRAIAAAGRFRSGRSDVSSDHDRHLVEAFRP